MKCPDAGAFLTGFIENHVDQRLAGLGIDLSKDLRCDLDEVALELALVPFCKNFSQLRRVHLQGVLQNGVGFTDQLNIAVLDAVVHHLDVMTGAIRAHVAATRFAIHLRGDLAKNGRDDVPRLARTAGHERRAFERAFFAAGNAHADKVNSFSFQFLPTSLRVSKKRVSSVDDHVASFEQRGELIDHGVHRRARFHHQHRYPRFFKCGDEFLQSSRRLNVFPFGAASSEFLGDFGGAIEHGDRKAL